MKFFGPLSALAVLGALAFAATGAVAVAYPAQQATARVTVQYVHPHKFTESVQAGPGHGYDHGDYLAKLKKYLVRKATPMLQPGQHLSIAITNIDLAGGYEPWRMGGATVRYMTSMYPPRINLQFTLTGADGKVVRQGTRKLDGFGYLHGPSHVTNPTDPLRYDKALLYKWLLRGPTHW